MSGQLFDVSRGLSYRSNRTGRNDDEVEERHINGHTLKNVRERCK